MISKALTALLLGLVMTSSAQQAPVAGTTAVPRLSPQTTESANTQKIVNSNVQTLAVKSLAPEFAALVAKRTEPAWIGYAVEATAGQRLLCCWESLEGFNAGARFGSGNCCGGCRLEGGDNYFSSDKSKCAEDQEPPTSVLVMFRASEGKVGKVRVFTPNCALDAGKVPVYWLMGVKPAESVALLTGLAEQNTSDNEERGTGRVAHMALQAIAMHKDSSADAALDRFVAVGRPEKLRQQAGFWLGMERGRHGFEVVRRLLREDQDDRLRDHMTFVLSQNKDAEALPLLIDIAKKDQSSKVRGQALFWLAQKAGQKAAGAISDAIENDPETEVKKKAVFALTQIPEGEGVPMLIQVARTNKNPVVRKQAIFWLGQSKDPRAFDFIESVLR